LTVTLTPGPPWSGEKLEMDGAECKTVGIRMAINPSTPRRKGRADSAITIISTVISLEPAH
jgi:hypothetical protein